MLQHFVQIRLNLVNHLNRGRVEVFLLIYYLRNSTGQFLFCMYPSKGFVNSKSSIYLFSDHLIFGGKSNSFH